MTLFPTSPFPPPCSYGPAYTMPASPRGPSNAFMPGGVGSLVNPSKNRSLRGGVVVRNGSAVLGKGMSLPGIMRSSSTLPRMSARQLQQPIPHNSPSFLRPNSSINFPSAPIAPASSPLVTQAQSFQSQPPPVPMHMMLSSPLGGVAPKPCDINDVYMDEFCKSITDHVLPDGECRVRDVKPHPYFEGCGRWLKAVPARKGVRCLSEGEVSLAS